MQYCLQRKGVFYVIKTILLAWEPRVAQVTQSYSCRLPALGRFYRKTKFLLSIHSSLNIKTKLRTLFWLSRVPQSKFEAKWLRGFRVIIGKTIRQTNRDYNFIYIDRDFWFTFVNITEESYMRKLL